MLNFDQKQHRIFGQKQHTSNAAATVFPRSGPLWLFLVPETEEAHERTTLSYDWGVKDGIEGAAEQDHKKWFFEVLRGLEKKVGTVYIFLKFSKEKSER